MKNTLLLILFLIVLDPLAGAQTSGPDFDTVLFNKNLESANRLVEYEYFSQLSSSNLSDQPENSSLEWFSYNENQIWHTIGGSFTGHVFTIARHMIIDSLYTISDYKGIYDTTRVNSSASALSQANDQFQLIRDTCNLYFNSFVVLNPDQTISIRFLPAFQPSGQAVYGYEWEYIYDKTGKILLHQKSYSKSLTAVWVGQPRELWINYRNTDKPTLGSVFFVLSFRDYFTRIRIDTRISTSTNAKDKNGKYIWTHKMK